MKLNKIALVISSVLTISACGTDDGESLSTTVAPSNPGVANPSTQPSSPSTEHLDSVTGAAKFTNVGVHDPSIVKANVEGVDTYYIFGSHLAAAKSTDLMNWEMISSLSNNANVNESPLFDFNYTGEFAEGIAWTDGFTGNWAANVIKAPNGKYWFYYNHCAQDNPDTDDRDEVCWNRSYLGLAEANSIEGPYVDKGIFLRSGYRSVQENILDGDGHPIPQTDSDGNELKDADGNTLYQTQTVFPEFADFPLDNDQVTWNGAVDPNVIDPTAFYDKEGGLWMVYGSYSGGIFVLEMDEATGKPVVGQGYGKHLVGGDFRAIEGPYVFYSPESDYYYLMVSTAGFAYDEGYNIRIARSKTPDGPYLDAAGNDIASAPGLDVGVKLMGGFVYTQEIAEEAESWGYNAPGHNSAIYDEATGRHLLVTHTRFPQSATEFPNNANAHQVRVHEMFVNEAGWLVASPQRYVPIDGPNLVNSEDVLGYYKFINHGSEVNNASTLSGHIALNADYTITGSETGTWYMLNQGQVALELESGKYNTVAKWQWDDHRQEVVATLSGLSSANATVWASKVDDITATAEVLADVEQTLDLPTELTINEESFVIPTIGRNGAKITWESSDEYYISNDGSIFIPTPDRGDQTVNLVATISLNGQSTTKSFTVDLKARPAFKNAVAHYQFEDNLNVSLGNFAAASMTGDRIDNTGGTEAYVAGQKGEAVSLDGLSGVRLPDDLINSYQYTISYWINPTEITNFSTSFFGAQNNTNWLSFLPGNWDGQTMLWSGSEQWVDLVSGMTIPTGQWSHLAATVNNGEAKFYINGELKASANNYKDLFSTAGSYFALGVNHWDLPFKGAIDELIIYDYALSSLDINGAAKNNLTDPDDFADVIKAALDLGDTSAVRDSFDLLRVGPFVSGISWVSDNPDYLEVRNGRAIVTQPSGELGDQDVTLTATITFKKTDGSFYTDTKVFDVTIKSLAPAEYSFEGDLTALNGSAEAGTVTGDRIDNTDGAVSYVEGVKGNALLLDGTSGVRLPNNLITTYDYAVSMWLKPNVITDYTTTFFGGVNTSSWVSFVPSAGGPTRLWSGTAWYDAEPGGTIPAQEWTHVAFSVANGEVKLYLNGELKFDGVGYPNVFGAGGTTYFGLGVNHWDVPFNGAIDELKIFGNSISQGKVSELFNEGELTSNE
ncbi:LamG-like jellyroll fold domain-containing protein [Catenovulum maritimum]|uniref:Beta-xylosidase n=1 Tax=Catenovulum maritimum TaxID=1513271 RepID=A0A0J8GN36_9ALTE|nr:LamG-like jellyroll fold domain-containing protein [Catenovulum maritimum]KMT64247.1 beta-xylosidase [Catenovulum maritimum]